MENDKIIEELKNDYKTAEEWVLFYREREAQYEQDNRYILDGSPAFRDTGRAGLHGNGWTEYKVVQLENLEDAEKWLMTVKYVESKLSSKKQIFLEMRRRAAEKNKTLQQKGLRKTNWIIYVQDHYAALMAKKYNEPKEKFWLSENTVKAWWRGIINTTRLIALKKKCVF